MGACLQFVYVSKRTSSSKILLLEFCLPLESFVLYSTNRGADDVQMEQRKELNKVKAGIKTRRQVER